MKTGAEPRAGSKEPAILDQTSELWRNSEILLTSSPTFADGTIYLVNKVGELCAIDPKTGTVNWRHKLGADQLHASPLYADGKLYIPMRYDGFHVIKPGEKAAEVLSHTTLEGEALGAPAVWNGKIYVHTTKKLYCFGSKSGSKAAAGRAAGGNSAYRRRADADSGRAERSCAAAWREADVSTSRARRQRPLRQGSLRR